MKKKRLFLSCGCALLFSVALASTNPTEVMLHQGMCPVITVICSSGKTCCGPKYTFTANITGGYADREPTYKWSVSVGTITKGQGTSSIEVDASNLDDKPMTAMVELGNIIPDGCPTTENYTTECSKPSNVVSRGRPCRGKRKN